MRGLPATAAFTGLALLALSAAAQDTCLTAVPISLNTNVVGTTVGASGSLPANSDFSCSGNDVGPNAEDHWYVFTPGATGSYTIELCGSQFDTTLTLLEGACPTGAAIFLACNDDGCHTQSRIEETLQAGTSYYIRIAGYSGAAGGYNLRVIPTPGAPANDDCAAATSVPFDSTVSGRTDHAITDGIASCPVDGSSHDAWHTFSPPATGQYVISLCGAEFDTTLTVYQGGCAAPVEIACNDDAGCGFAGRVSQATVAMTQGQTYLIRVASWADTEGGHYDLRITSGDPPPANDDCAGAVVVASLPFTHSVNTIFASPDGPPGSCNSGDVTELENSVWYTYTPAADEKIEILVDAAHDQLVNIYSGSNCSNLTEVRCHDEDDQPANFFADLVGGTTYWIGVGEWGAEGGGATDVLFRAIEVGACCTSAGCAVMTDIECADEGGAFQGAGSSCAEGTPAAYMRTTGIGEVILGPNAGTISTDSQIVAGAPSQIGEVEITIDLLHSFPGDLHIDLIHVPSGVTVRLWEENCLFAATDMIVTYDDEASPITCVDPLLNVTARPLSRLGAFNGLNANGEWRLRIADQFDGDGGELISWTLRFTAADPEACPEACVCETDGDGAQVNVFDLLAYLDLWFPAAAGADIDGDPGVDVFDLLFFLDCWFPASAGAPCP